VNSAMRHCLQFALNRALSLKYLVPCLKTRTKISENGMPCFNDHLSLKTVLLGVLLILSRVSYFLVLYVLTICIYS